MDVTFGLAFHYSVSASPVSIVWMLLFIGALTSQRLNMKCRFSVNPKLNRLSSILKCYVNYNNLV